MFEPGERVEISMLEWGDNGPGPVMSTWNVSAVDGTLLHLENPETTMELMGNSYTSPRRELVVNTASLYFVSAKPVEQG